MSGLHSTLRFQFSKTCLHSVFKVFFLPSPYQAFHLQRSGRGQDLFGFFFPLSVYLIKYRAGIKGGVLSNGIYGHSDGETCVSKQEMESQVLLNVSK